MSSDQKILLQKAILEIRDLKSRLKRVQDQYVEPIAIVGASCRFPGGANSLDAFWDRLQSGYNGISTVPAERWDGDAYYDPDPDAPGKICTKSGGFLDVSAFEFDPHFFSISPREAESLDPQQRLLLELCWEAIEQANIIPETLFKTNTGVFMGVSSLDNATRIIGEAPSTDIDGYYGTGIALAPAAGRISYLFGFTGPSFVVDTACSSSLLSLHLACESLRRKECDMALGGGVQLLTHPGVSVAFTKARMLSVDGLCRTFDADANGYVRGEGGGVMLLKRLSDAQRDNDTILAVIRGSGVNQDGASGGLTVPSGPSQESVIRTALSMSGLSPQDIGYVEAHGTGTPLGDPIEIGALNAVYGPGHSKSNPLLVGSLKTNIGHLEAGAGIASAIKVMLSLKHKSIAPHLNFNTPNPMIPWNSVSVEVPTKPLEWKLTGTQNIRSAGVSSFGFSGTNVHLIMSEAPQTEPEETSKTTSADTFPPLLVLSAKTKRSLQLLAQKHAVALKSCPNKDWKAYTNTAASNRSKFAYCLAVVAENPSDASPILADWAQNGIHPALVESKVEEGSQSKVLMVFSGQGSQYAQMGKELYKKSASFRQDMDLCDRLMQPILGYSILKCIFDGEQDLNQTVNTQPALFALEVSLARLWMQFGGKIDGVIGHSVGEYAAAVVSGVMSLEDAAVMIAHRGKLMQSLPLDGGMLAVFTGLNELKQILDTTGLEVSIATSNSASSQVLSGLKSELEKARKVLDQKGIDSKELVVSHAFHSELMDPILEDFRKIASKANFKKPEIPFFTNVTGDQAPELISTPDYWVRQIREAVLFHDAVQVALQDGFTTIIEAGPKSTLVNLVKRIVRESEVEDSPLLLESLLNDSNPDSTQFIKALGTFWCAGGSVNQDIFGSGRMDIPTYAFDRSFYKKEVALDVATGIKSDKKTSFGSFSHPLIHDTVDSPILDSVLFKSSYSVSELDVLRDHKVFGRYVVAGAAHLSLAVGAAQHFWKQDAVQLKDVMFPTALVLPENEAVSVHLSISRKPDSNAFRLVSLQHDVSEPITHALGSTSVLNASQKTSKWNESSRKDGKSLDPASIYEIQSKRQIVVGESYKWIKSVHVGLDVAVAELVPPVGLPTERFSLHPGMLDSCFGVLVMTANMDVEETFIPFGVKSVSLYRSIRNEPLRVIATKQKVDNQNGILIGDIQIESESGEVLAILEGMEGRKASISALLKSDSTPKSSLIYDKKWVKLPDSDTNTASGEILAVVLPGVDPQVLIELHKIPSSRIVILGDAALVSSEKDDTVLNVYSSKDLDAFWLGQRQIPDQILFCSNDLNTSDLSSLTDQLLVVSLFLQGLIRNRVLVPVSTVNFIKFDQSGSPAIPVFGAALDSLLKSVGREYAEISGAQLCVDTIGNSSSDWHRKLIELTKQKESVWIKGSDVLVSRLIPTQLNSGSTSHIDPTGTYMITGGSGALAGHLVDYLLSRGSKHIVLLSRNPKTDQKESLSAKSERFGAKIDVISCDITNNSSTKTSIDSKLPKSSNVKGIFHLAGATADVSFLNLTKDHLEQTLSPKLIGLANLVSCLDVDKLDFVVNYSSIAAAFGNAGQESYAAANAAMESWSSNTLAPTCKVKSILWGPWKQQGMASNLGKIAHDMVTKNGITPISNEQADSILDAVLAHDASLSVIAGDFNWDTDFFDLALTRNLRSPKEAKSKVQSFEEELNLIPIANRKRHVTTILNSLLVGALRLPEKHTIDPRERLFDLGVDSLIAIELKNQLQKKLGKQVSSTLLFDYPTLEKLSDHVLSLVAVQEVKVDEKVQSQDTILNENIDEMSEEDAEMALLRALSGIQGDENG